MSALGLFLEFPAAAIVAVAWVFALTSIRSLPARIPTHFGLNGAADASGPATSLWLLPSVITATFVLLSAVQLMPPRYMNLPVKITEHNREGVYALAGTMLTALKVCTLLLLLTAEWGSIDAATRGSLNPLFFPSIAVLVILNIGLMSYFTRKMRAV